MWYGKLYVRTLGNLHVVLDEIEKHRHAYALMDASDDCRRMCTYMYRTNVSFDVRIARESDVESESEDVEGASKSQVFIVSALDVKKIFLRKITGFFDARI